MEKTGSGVAIEPNRELGEDLQDNTRPTEFAIPWETYSNTEFKFQLSLPRLLYKNEFKNQGGYIFFARFEENKFSQGKGVALGIKEGKIQAEVEGVKRDFEEKASLEEEKKVNVAGSDGVYLRFKPKEQGLEERVIVFFEKEAKVYSVSTTPKQIDKIIESFKFLE
ncbi:MAG: hypothetical protein QW279_07890 [Candidatus Jordarchaeaceae archaeon]